MDFMTILENRRSIRSFTGEPISEDSKRKILLAANAAPAAHGKYDSVHLTDVTNKEILAELEKNMADMLQIYDRSFLHNTPELIIVSTASTDNVGYSNASIIAHNMVLGAVDEGVGVCHIWGCIMALCQNPELIKKLGIPEGFTPACAVSLGKTTETYTKREIPENRIQINYL